LHVDYLAADHASTFEHGNLVRGVCVLGMLSQTFAIALGPHAQPVYLQNARLDAVTAHAAGLVHHLCVGVTATQRKARYASTVATSAPDSKDLAKAVRCYRASIDLGTLAHEAVGHTECQATNAGFAKSQLKSHTSTSVSEGSLNLWTVVDHGSTPRAALRGLGTMLSIDCLGAVAHSYEDRSSAWLLCIRCSALQ
jgi:enoyl-CoA hydratase/carnithine racemase